MRLRLHRRMFSVAAGWLCEWHCHYNSAAWFWGRLHPCACAAGCALAALRMAVWVAVLLADAAWLTDNNTTIRGAPAHRVGLAQARPWSDWSAPVCELRDPSSVRMGCVHSGATRCYSLAQQISTYQWWCICSLAMPGHPGTLGRSGSTCFSW